jgi:hypothetical protein
MLSVCGSTVLRKIFGPKREKVIGGWRKLHKKELHDLYSSKVSKSVGARDRFG